MPHRCLRHEDKRSWGAAREAIISVDVDLTEGVMTYTSIMASDTPSSVSLNTERADGQPRLNQDDCDYALYLSADDDSR